MKLKLFIAESWWHDYQKEEIVDMLVSFKYLRQLQICQHVARIHKTICIESCLSHLKKLPYGARRSPGFSECHE